MEAPTIDPKFIVNVQGQEFIQYKGLITMAHNAGLQSLSATFLHVSPEIVTATATVVMENGQTFTECGDATPSNVGHRVAPHFARMALTRAKARALRDALNIHMVSTAEIGDLSSGVENNFETGELATNKQIGFLCHLLVERGIQDGDKKDLIHMVLGDETLKSAASSAIEAIKSTDYLHPKWMSEYVKMLFDRSKTSRDALKNWMMDNFDTANPAKIINKEDQKSIISFLLNQEGSETNSSPDNEDAYIPGESIESPTPTTQEWIDLVKNICEETGLGMTEVEKWIRSVNGVDDNRDLTYLPASAYLQAKELYPAEILSSIQEGAEAEV